jgi:hypothetical protein
MNSKGLALVSIGIAVAIAIIAFFTFSPDDKRTTFSVNFRLIETNMTVPHYRQPMNAWDVRVYKNTDATLRDVDVWIDGELVRHYDYISTGMGIAEQVYRPIDRGISVTIYWEGGQETFTSEYEP